MSCCSPEPPLPASVSLRSGSQEDSTSLPSGLVLTPGVEPCGRTDRRCLLWPLDSGQILGFLVGEEGKCLAALVGWAQAGPSLSLRTHWCSGRPSLPAAHPTAGPALGHRRLREPGGALPIALVLAHRAAGVGFLPALVTEVSEQLVLP